MLRLLTRLFIKDSEDVSNPDVRRRYGVLCGGMGIFLNLLLFAGKFAAGLLTSSIAITADALNNLSDAGSSIVTLIGFQMAGQQADRDHPFGHGRIEYLAGLLVSLVILLMGFELGKSSVQKIIHPEAVEFSLLSVAILAAAILVKLWMFWFNRAAGKKINSAAMHATAMDSLSDTAATAVVLVCMVVAHFTSLQLDGWAGALVALFILYTGFKSARETISPLLGQTPDPAFVKGVEQTVLSYPDIVGIHDLIVHDYGPGRMMISLHAEVPANADILKMHDTIDVAERELQKKYGCSAVIHMDPIVTDDEVSLKKRDEIAALVKLIDPSITIHDFRMTSGPRHTNLIFDIVVPHRFRLSDEEIVQTINDAVRALEGGEYYAVITVDKAYV